MSLHHNHYHNLFPLSSWDTKMPQKKAEKIATSVGYPGRPELLV